MIYINESTFCLSFALAEQSSVAASDMGRFIFIFAALQTLSKKLGKWCLASATAIHLVADFEL